MRMICQLAADTRGNTAIEYTLIAALIVLAIMGSLIAFGGSNQALWDQTFGSIVAAMQAVAS